MAGTLFRQGGRASGFRAAAFRSLFRNVVVVMGKKPLQEEHRQKPGQDIPHGLHDREVLMNRVRDEVEQCHAQHQPGHEARRDLQPQVGQAHGQQNPATRQGGQRHQQTIARELRGRGNEEVVHIWFPYNLVVKKTG